MHRFFFDRPGVARERHAPATLFVPFRNQTATTRLLSLFPPGTGRWLFGFPEGTKRVAGRWRSAPPPVSVKKAMHPGWACQRAGTQTVRAAVTPRLCHPAGVRALLGPVSGGVATHRRGSLREPDGSAHAPRTGYILAMPPASPAVPGGNPELSWGGVEKCNRADEAVVRFHC